MKKGQAGIWIGMLIVIILAMVSIQVAFTLIDAKQRATAIDGDQFTAQVNTTCTRLLTDCFQVGSLDVVNDTTADNLLGNFVECGEGGDYYGTQLRGDNSTSLIGATLNASYTQVDCQPIGGLTATIINYIPLIMAVVVLIFVAGFTKA